MRDKYGRYVYVREIKDMRIFKADEYLTVIQHREYPNFLALEILEKGYVYAIQNPSR
jgi:hypothetical protein